MRLNNSRNASSVGEQRRRTSSMSTRSSFHRVDVGDSFDTQSLPTSSITNKQCNNRQDDSSSSDCGE